MARGRALWHTAAGFLEPGEHIEEILLARRAPPAVMLIVNLWLYVLGGRWYAIIVTDRAVTVLRCGHLGTAPRSIQARLSRGPQGSLSAPLGSVLELNGRYLVRHRVPRPRAANAPAT